MVIMVVINMHTIMLLSLNQHLAILIALTLEHPFRTASTFAPTLAPNSQIILPSSNLFGHSLMEVHFIILGLVNRIHIRVLVYIQPLQKVIDLFLIFFTLLTLDQILLYTADIIPPLRPLADTETHVIIHSGYLTVSPFHHKSRPPSFSILKIFFSRVDFVTIFDQL